MASTERSNHLQWLLLLQSQSPTAPPSPSPFTPSQLDHCPFPNIPGTLHYSIPSFQSLEVFIPPHPVQMQPPLCIFPNHPRRNLFFCAPSAHCSSFLWDLFNSFLYYMLHLSHEMDLFYLWKGASLLCVPTSYHRASSRAFLSWYLLEHLLSAWYKL